MKRIVVDRATWRCGGGKLSLPARNRHGEGLTQLRNDQGYCCCLGFLSQQCGLSDEQIDGVPGMYNLPPVKMALLDKEFAQYGLSFAKLAGNVSRVSTQPIPDSEAGFFLRAVRINDHSKLSDAERETQLTELFRENGFELVFEGSYEDEVQRSES